jgi:hypothetical protein
MQKPNSISPAFSSVHCPEFITQHSDDSLVTNSRNLKASAYWKGQIRVAVQDGSLHFLFENKGVMYDGKGFKMLAVLNQHWRPNSVANAFTTLLLLFNDSMGTSEEIMAFRSWFDEMIKNMARCKIVIPPILMVMFFLRLLHSCYDDILKQFWLHYKSLEGASFNSVVADVHYHDKVKIMRSNKKVPASKTPKAAAAAASFAVVKQGKQWSNPYGGWLVSTSKASKSIGCILSRGLVFVLSAIGMKINMPQHLVLCWRS